MLVDTPKPAQPWIGAINRLLRAELRPDPRPKPHKAAHPKYWNAQDLAAAADIRANTLSDVMRGKREPSVDTLMKVAAALGVPPAAMLMDEHEALSYTKFRQSLTETSKIATVEETVRRLLDARAEQMKTAWVELASRDVLAQLTAPVPAAVPVAAPHKHKKRA